MAEKSLKKGDEKAWHSDQSNHSSLRHFHQNIYSAKGLLFFISENNRYINWLESGRDYLRFSLAATKQKFYLHPCNQIIQ